MRDWNHFSVRELVEYGIERERGDHIERRGKTGEQTISWISCVGLPASENQLPIVPLEKMRGQLARVGRQPGGEKDATIATRS